MFTITREEVRLPIDSGAVLYNFTNPINQEPYYLKLKDNLEIRGEVRDGERVIFLRTSSLQRAVLYTGEAEAYTLLSNPFTGSPFLIHHTRTGSSYIGGREAEAILDTLPLN